MNLLLVCLQEVILSKRTYRKILVLLKINVMKENNFAW